MSLYDCSGAQGIRNTFLWSAFQIILNFLIYFPTRTGTEAREPESSPRGVQSYYILTRLAHRLLLGPAPLLLGNPGRTMSRFKENLRVQLAAEHWTLHILSLNLFTHDCLKAEEGVLFLLRMSSGRSQSYLCRPMVRSLPVGQSQPSTFCFGSSSCPTGSPACFLVLPLW